MASLTQWTWVWASSRRWWGTRGLMSMGSQRVRYNWMTKHSTVIAQLTEALFILFSITFFTFCDLFWIVSMSAFYFFFILFFNFTILYWFCHISKWICHKYTCVPHLELSCLLPPHTIPLGRPRAPAPSIQYRALNLDWWLVSYMILYMFQCHSPKSSHPFPLPQSPKDCSIHQCLFCCLVYRVIVTIFLNSIYMH